MAIMITLINIVKGITNGAIGDPHVIADKGGQPKSTTGRLMPVCSTIACAAGPTLFVKISKIA